MLSESSLAVHGVVETSLYTDDIARLTSFYRDALGFPLMLAQEDRFRAFDAGRGSTLLLFRRGGTTAPVPAPRGLIPPHDGTGPLHLAFAIADADYDRWRDQLVRHGVTLESEAGWERGGRSLFFRDPDGHLVELVTPGIWPNY